MEKSYPQLTLSLYGHHVQGRTISQEHFFPEKILNIYLLLMALTLSPGSLPPNDLSQSPQISSG